MTLVDALLRKKLIPIVNHANPWFAFMEEEAARAARGLLVDREVHFFVVNSARPNAHSFLDDGKYFITITDGLFRVLEASIETLVVSDIVVKFMHDWLQIEYDVGLAVPAQNRWSARPPDLPPHVTEAMRYRVVDEIFDHALRFTLLHEVAHILHGDAGGTMPELPNDIYLRATRAIDITTVGGTGANRHLRHREYEADREAACWLMQAAIRRAELDGGGENGVKHLGLAAFGMVLVAIHLSRHTPDSPEVFESLDYPSYDIRMEGVGEGTQLVLNDVLTVVSAATIFRMMTQARRVIESLSGSAQPH
jgi:hypothetical protein